MNAEQVKNEIRKLSRNDKVEIYRWIDEEGAADLLSRIGVYRSPEMHAEAAQKCQLSTHNIVYLSESLKVADHLDGTQNGPSVIH
jgi:hypothetical protein